jgi:hypothetical protein
MALITCSDCGKEHSDSAVSCPNCGARPPKSKFWLWGVLLCVAIFIAFGLFARRTSTILDTVSPEKNAGPGASAEMQRLVDHSKVDQCWQDASHASISMLNEQQAGCRILEKEFVHKYNIPY